MYDVRIPRLFLTALTGIGTAVVLHQLAPAGNGLDFLVDEFLANHHESPTALITDEIFLRKFDQNFFNGQVYVAEDCGGAIKNKRIDIYVATHAEGEAKGTYDTEVYLLK